MAITAALTLIVWFTGPLDTFEAMPSLFRLVYWGGLILGSVPFAFYIRITVTRLWRSLPLPAVAVVTSLLFSAVYTPVVYGVTLIAAEFGLATMVTLQTMWATTFLAAACAYAVRTLLIEQDQIAAVEAANAGSETRSVWQPRLLQRLDSSVRGPLVSISVRNHYVDVRTAAGQASVLMRLSDAIAETEGVDGAQVHRSHWVAWDAVQAVDRRGGNVMLRMVNGEPIPVSRNYREKLEERSLL